MPITTQPRRPVATYSIATNRPKNSSDVPRSRSKTRTPTLITQATRIGPRSRPRGTSMPSTRVRATASASRFTTR